MVSEHEHRCPQEQRGDPDHWELELQLVVNYLTWDPSLGLLEGKNMQKHLFPHPHLTFHIQSNSNFSNLESPSSLTDETPGQVSGLRAGRQDNQSVPYRSLPHATL